jgi:hypothetical protein
MGVHRRLETVDAGREALLGRSDRGHDVCGSVDARKEIITMTTRKTTTTTELRRCAGSKTVGIEPREAPVADFPVQPSRKDGLGVMCKPHWTEYTRALRQAAKARHVAQTEGNELTGAIDAAIAREAKRAREAPKVDPKVAEAEALIAEVDAPPGPEAVKRNGDPDVQAALPVRQLRDRRGPVRVHQRARDRPGRQRLCPGWTPQQVQRRRQVPLAYGWTGGFTLRPDGLLLGTCEGCHEIRVLDTEDGHALAPLPWPLEGDSAGFLNLDPDGNVYGWSSTPVTSTCSIRPAG